MSQVTSPEAKFIAALVLTAVDDANGIPSNIASKKSRRNARAWLNGDVGLIPLNLCADYMGVSPTVISRVLTDKTWC